MTHYDDQLKEVQDRTRRIETSLYKIRDHLGVTPNDTDRVVTVLHGGDVEVRGHDVTLARIRKELIACNAFVKGTPVGVYVNDELIAEITFYT